ncbi:hypothetical protein CFP65_6443 [Kitasatospora sp. MMS16-BH015]|uniref:RNA polymerase sigma factor n=1 Tax=Kitasatospora sp. MMS16-BH015 TaxID=2018025 RepID=UPI000CA20DAB|nr:sigma-70 family RNA polymerase sigma factor [Kitasatospora sp. MMS16-BH015]AUG81099.1 hypothetical protein CFP65_6443 [Kitasatospora sp. MMS16-BH015]
MNDAAPLDPAGIRPGTSVLPTTFLAFLEGHGQPYFEYAELALGDSGLAQDVVDDVLSRLATRWEHVLAQPSYAAYCWRLMRHVVEAERSRREEHLQLIERVAFSVAATKEIVEEMLDTLTPADHLEEGMALGAAIRSLSGAKYDVVVMRYLMEMTDSAIAAEMGVEEATVRSLLSQARTRLAAQLKPRRVLRDRTAGHPPRTSADGRPATADEE